MNKSFIILFFLTIPLLFSEKIKASEFKLMAGGTVTIAPTALMGVSGGMGLLTNKTGNFFGEFDLIFHYLRNPGSSSEDDGDDVSINFSGYELSGFLLFGEKDGFFGGPGLGYGTARVEEIPGKKNHVNRDPSSFFSATDIHYGSGSLKLGYWQEGITYEIILSSFGGLMGGTFLCGFLF
ncbi:MAG: hypothetical protein GY786_22675 [Proteobacteria bacterium]|nr:hypothetical protein [Pseudomonadota bacterium]